MSHKKIILNAGQSPFGWHRYQAFMQCPRKYALSYIEEAARVESAPLIKGSLIHLGLAQHYGRMRLSQNGLDSETLEEPLKAMEIEAKENGELWEEELEHCQFVLDMYRKDEGVLEWESDLEILIVEEFFTLKIGEAPLTLRADLVARIKSENKIFVIDHKTTSYYRKTASEGYRASGQFTGYRLAGESVYGKDFGGLIFNFLQHGGKAKKKIKFMRELMLPANGHLKRFPSAIDYYWNQIQALKGTPTHLYPRAISEFTCVHKYGKCPYYDKCLHS